MKKYIIVDFDGTLTKIDSTIEAFFNSFFKKPIRTINLLLKGKVFLKNKLFQSGNYPNSQSIPLDEKIIEEITYYKNKGYTAILLSGTSEEFLQEIKFPNNLFDQVIGTKNKENMIGMKKIELLENMGIQDYIYLGNSNDDLLFSKYAKKTIIFNMSFFKKILNQNKNVKFKNTKKPYIKILFDHLRIKHWVKNLLIFFPLLIDSSIRSYNSFLEFLPLFLFMSLSASTVYMFNDYLDLENDRKHKKKSNRPLASGDISIIHNFLLCLFLIFLALPLSILINYKIFVIVCIYFLLNIFYSTYGKKIPILDLILLSNFYCIRIFSGVYIFNLEFTFWLPLFSFFFFVNLAIIKRLSDFFNNDKKITLDGRSYNIGDELALLPLGVASGISSIIILGLYINTDSVLLYFSYPNYLYFLLILVYFWISRMWLFLVRGEINYDPVTFAIKDKTSLLIGILSILIVLLSQ